MLPDQTFICSHCDQPHPGPPMSYRRPAPDHWSAELAADPANVLEQETCVIGNQAFFTLNLKTRVHTRPIGQHPFVELEPTSHPPAVEQRQGIPVDYHALKQAYTGQASANTPPEITAMSVSNQTAVPAGGRSPSAPPWATRTAT